jgi:hypothetical protein
VRGAWSRVWLSEGGGGERKRRRGEGGGREDPTVTQMACGFVR